MSIADKPCALFRSGTAQVPARARFRNSAKTQDGSAALGQIIWRYPDGGPYLGASESRRDGAAVGF